MNRCLSCGNRMRRTIRCSLCGSDTAGEYLRAKYRDGNIITANLYCADCVDAARIEIGLEVSADDSAALIRHLARKQFDKFLERADREADAEWLQSVMQKN